MSLKVCQFPNVFRVALLYFVFGCLWHQVKVYLPVRFTENMEVCLGLVCGWEGGGVSNLMHGHFTLLLISKWNAVRQRRTSTDS